MQNCEICAKLTANMHGMTSGDNCADDLRDLRGVYALGMAGAAEINVI